MWEILQPGQSCEFFFLRCVQGGAVFEMSHLPPVYHLCSIQRTSIARTVDGRRAVPSTGAALLVCSVQLWSICGARVGMQHHLLQMRQNFRIQRTALHWPEVQPSDFVNCVQSAFAATGGCERQVCVRAGGAALPARLGGL